MVLPWSLFCLDICNMFTEIFCLKIPQHMWYVATALVNWACVFVVKVTDHSIPFWCLLCHYYFFNSPTVHSTILIVILSSGNGFLACLDPCPVFVCVCDKCRLFMDLDCLVLSYLWPLLQEFLISRTLFSILFDIFVLLFTEILNVFIESRHNICIGSVLNKKQSHL